MISSSELIYPVWSARPCARKNPALPRRRTGALSQIKQDGSYGKLLARYNLPSRTPPRSVRHWVTGNAEHFMQFDWHYTLGLYKNGDFWRAVIPVVELSSLETWLCWALCRGFSTLAR